MKKCIGMLVTTLLVYGLLTGIAFAQPSTWETPDQSTIGWDAVSTLSNGNPIPATDEVLYEVYLAPYPIIERDNVLLYQNLTDPPITATTFTITFIDEGTWLAGVRSVRVVKDAGGVEIGREPSDTVSWTDDPTVCLGGTTFGWRFFITPSSVIQLKNIKP